MKTVTREQMIDAIVERHLKGMDIHALRHYFRMNEYESLDEWSDEIIQIEYEEQRQ